MQGTQTSAPKYMPVASSPHTLHGPIAILGVEEAGGWLIPPSLPATDLRPDGTWELDPFNVWNIPADCMSVSVYLTTKQNNTTIDTRNTRTENNAEKLQRIQQETQLYI